MVRGFPEATAKRLVDARKARTFDSTRDLGYRAGLNRKELRLLAGANALQGLTGHRRHAHWSAAGVERTTEMLSEAPIQESLPDLAPPTEGQDLVADFASLGLTPGRHPLALLRAKLTRMHLSTAEELRGYPHGRPARAAGIVIGRQRPDTASGVVFVTFEDVGRGSCGPLHDPASRASVACAILNLSGKRFRSNCFTVHPESAGSARVRCARYTLASLSRCWHLPHDRRVLQGLHASQRHLQR